MHRMQINLSPHLLTIWQYLQKKMLQGSILLSSSLPVDLLLLLLRRCIIIIDRDTSRDNCCGNLLVTFLQRVSKISSNLSHSLRHNLSFLICHQVLLLSRNNFNKRTEIELIIRNNYPALFSKLFHWSNLLLLSIQVLWIK